MKNKVRKNFNKDECLELSLSLPNILKETCTNKDILVILQKLENTTKVEEQISIIHSFSSYLNNPTNEYLQIVLQILTNLFVTVHPKNPVKKSILRLFANAKSLEILTSNELSVQLANLIEIASLENDCHRCNNCINSINDCFNNCPAGVQAVTLISEKVFQFLVNCLELFLNELGASGSPSITQQVHIYIHNTTRCLVAVCQQCNNIKSIITRHIDDIYKYCAVIFRNPDILYDTKNNCGIILTVTANSQCENGYFNLLEITFSENRRGVSFPDFKEDIAVTCIYSGILNTVKAERICNYDDSFKNSDIYKISDKLLNISKQSADKPSVILGADRALLLVSRSLTPLNEEHLIQIVTNLLDHIWTQLDHYVDTIRHVTRSILINLVKLSVIRRENGQCSALNIIIDNVLQTSIFKTGRYVALSIIANEIGCEILLQKEPNLASQLLKLVQEPSLSSYAVSCYENLMKCHIKEVNEENWLEKWVYPLTIELGLDEELNKKGYCLQILLTVAIKQKPSILNKMLKQWTIDNELQLSSLLKCTLIARKIGIEIKQDENNWRGMLKYSVLELAKCHQNDEVRISSLSLIADSHKSTEIFTEWELHFVVDFLYYNINAQLPSTRQRILFLIKKILTRFSESYYGIIRNVMKETSNDLFQQQKTTYENFIFDLRQCIFDSLFPGANFSRRIICLEVLTFLEPILQDVSKYLDIPIEKLWKRSEVDALILCLDDSYESNKKLATHLLRNCPQDLLKLHTIPDTNEFLQNALKHANSIKPADTLTSAYLFETCMYSTVIKEVLIHLLDMDSPTNYSAQYLIIKLLLNNVQHQVNIGKTSLLKAAASSPMYGILFCLRHLIEKYLFTSDLTEIHWKQLMDEIINTSFDVSEIVCPVVNSSSPEGHLPMDHETVDEEDDEIITAQMLLVCAWRSVKEVSLLLGEITLNSTISSESQNGLITEEQVLKIGEHFTVLLTETKHRGAFEQAYVGFSKLCSRLWRCKSEKLHQLPIAWLNDIVSAISGINATHNNKLCATRRSAGVPFMIQAIVASELQTGASSNFHRCITTLLHLANNSSDNLETRTHAMNVLRALYRHTQLGEEISPYVTDGVIVAIKGFSKKTWAERNSATLLFSSLMTRIFGVQRTRDTDELNIRNRMTARVFFLRHPALHPFILNQLQQLTDVNCEPHKEIALYPILLLLARLYPTNSEEHDENNQLQDFVPYVRTCANNRSLKTRELAAKALIPLVLTQQRSHLLKELFSLLKKSKKHNFIHGILLQIYYLLPTINNIEKCINNSTIYETIWILHCNISNSCAIIAALYMQIITKIIAKCQLTLDISEKIFSILSSQDDFIQNNCIIGKLVYYRTALFLQMQLLIRGTNLNKHSKIFDFILNNLCHSNQDVKEFILNFLICFLQCSERRILVDNMELPEQEKLLVKLICSDSKIKLIATLKSRVIDLIKFLKLILSNDRQLFSKALFVLSNFEEAIFELAQNKSFFKSHVYNNDQDISCAVICCMNFLLKNSSESDRDELLKIFLTFSSSKYNVSCRYSVALVVTQNSFLLSDGTKLNIDNLTNLWKIVMRLLGDNESVVRNTICSLTRNHPIAEKAREELLDKCVDQIGKLSEDQCISLLIFWALTDIDLVENDDELELQIFERGEVSTYIEDMCLSKLSTKMLSKLIYCKDMSDIPGVFIKIINILITDHQLWSANIFDRDILIAVLKEITNELQRSNLSVNVLKNYLYESKNNFWKRLNIFYKYKIMNIIKSIILYSIDD